MSSNKPSEQAHAYDMFDFMATHQGVYAAKRLEGLYNSGKVGRIPERVTYVRLLSQRIKDLLAVWM